MTLYNFFFFFSSRRRHTRWPRDWSSDVCSSDLKNILAKIVDVKPDEIRALWLGFVFNFMVLGSYYVIKPVRDDIGAHNGVQNLWWMFTGTLLVALVANTAFSAIVARMSRRQFIPIVYRFFILNLAIFYLAMHYLSNTAQFWVGTAFFFWVCGAFNLFILTFFLLLMSDVFRSKHINGML